MSRAGMGVFFQIIILDDQGELFGTNCDVLSYVPLLEREMFLNLTIHSKLVFYLKVRSIGELYNLARPSSFWKRKITLNNLS